MVLSFLGIPHLSFSVLRVSTKLSFITMHRIPKWDEVVMNRKCYKSINLPLVIHNDPLLALANIARVKSHCKPKNHPFIFHPARLLVDGEPAVGVMGIICVLRFRREAAQGK
jgi:hypothetical protein